MILISYVDELFLIGSEPLMIEHTRELASEFEMKDCEIYFQRYESAWIH